MTNQEVMKLATEHVGDGQEPNMFFVTTSPYYTTVDEFGDRDSERFEGFESGDSTETLLFNTYAEAESYFDEVELDVWDGIGSVMIEDRLTGQIAEKTLERRVKVDYIQTEHNDAKYFGYKK